jgi:hypothetical protein
MNTETHEQTHVSRFFLEHVLCGEIALERFPEQKAHIAACSRCAGYLNTAPVQAAALTDAYPSFAQLHSRHAPRKERAVRDTGWRSFFDELLTAPWARPAAAFALICLAAVGISIRTGIQQQPLPAIKGAAHFTLFVNGQPAAPDDGILQCRPGDTLQLTLTAPEPVYYRVLYQDDRKKIAAYLPGPNEAQLPVGGSAGVTLPHAIILDAAWQQEKLYCLWSPKPFSQRAAVTRAEKDESEHPGAGAIHRQVITLVRGDR